MIALSYAQYRPGFHPSVADKAYGERREVAFDFDDLAEAQPLIERFLAEGAVEINGVLHHRSPIGKPRHIPTGIKAAPFQPQVDFDEL